MWSNTLKPKRLLLGHGVWPDFLNQDTEVTTLQPQLRLILRPGPWGWWVGWWFFYISQKNIEFLCRLVRIVWIRIIFQSLILTNPLREPCSTSPRPGRLRQSQQFSASLQYGPSSVPQRQAQQPCQKWLQNPWQADEEYKKPCRLLIQEVLANFCFSSFIYLNLYIGLKG